MNNYELIDKILFGIAVGDALGFPAQFESRQVRKKNPIVDMGKYADEMEDIQSWEDDLIGLWSDDTSLTLCLAESLLDGFNLQDQAEKFVAWLDTGYMSALNYAFDEGVQTVESLSTVRDILEIKDFGRLENLSTNADEQSNGNGSLMRILPLLIYIKGRTLKEQFDLIYKASSLTHPHIRSALCCFLYLKIAEYVIEPYTDFETILTQAQADTLSVMKSFNCSIHDNKEMERLLTENFGDIQENDIDSGGYVVSSLEASIWCIVNSNSFSEAVLKAVNLGNDTDTIGAITGGLAALIYGKEEIPKSWTDNLIRVEIINALVSKYEDWI